MPSFLTEKDIKNASKVTISLQKEFSAVLEFPLLNGLRSSLVAKKLGVNRMTCQRISKLQTTDCVTPLLLIEIPGVSGLLEFLDGMKNAGTPQKKLEGAMSAVEAFSNFLRKLNLSHTKLMHEISLHFEATNPKQRLARRKKLFEAASAVMGQSADTSISMMALTSKKDLPSYFEQIAIRGYSQIRAIHSSMPIRIAPNAAFSNYRKIGNDEVERNKPVLIEQFCSTPLPTIDTRKIKEQNLAQIINPEHLPIGEPFDCFASQHNIWNVKAETNSNSILMYNDYPTKSCIFDIYLHSLIDERLRITSDCHLWGTALLAPPEDDWMKRFTEDCDFKVLGRGTALADSSNYSKHKALTQHMFDLMGWDPNDFTGYRCEVQMPIWRSGISMNLLPK